MGQKFDNIFNKEVKKLVRNFFNSLVKFIVFFDSTPYP